MGRRWLRIRSALAKSIQLFGRLHSRTSRLSDNPLPLVVVVFFFLRHWLVRTVPAGTGIWREPTNGKKTVKNIIVVTCHLSNFWETFCDLYLQDPDYRRHRTELQQLPLTWRVFSRPRSSEPRWIPFPKMEVQRQPPKLTKHTHVKATDDRYTDFV